MGEQRRLIGSLIENKPDPVQTRFLPRDFFKRNILKEGSGQRQHVWDSKIHEDPFLENDQMVLSISLHSSMVRGHMVLN